METSASDSDLDISEIKKTFSTTAGDCDVVFISVGVLISIFLWSVCERMKKKKRKKRKEKKNRRTPMRGIEPRPRR